MPTKTLHITNFYHPHSGGIRTMYHALLRAAERERRPMRLVVPGEVDRVEEWGEFTRIYHLAAPQSPWFDSQYRIILPHRFLFPISTALRRIVENERPDLIEVCDKFVLSWLAGAIRKNWIPRAGRPLLVGLSCERLDDNVAVYVGPRWRWAARLFMQQIYGRLFDRHIAVSPYVAEEMGNAHAASRSPVTVLPMGVDADSFGPRFRSDRVRQDLLSKAGGGDTTRLLLYVGRLSREKNIQLLVEMMRALMSQNGNRPAQDLRLLVAGGGPLESWLREQSRVLNGRITLLGHVPHGRALAQLFSNVDAMVHPNPREPFGIALLEAMCSEVPLVAPARGGVLSYCTEQNSWLAEPDGSSFAAAVREVFADPARRTERVSQARCTALAHAWDQIAGRFFATYDTFCQEALEGTRMHDVDEFEHPERTPAW